MRRLALLMLLAAALCPAATKRILILGDSWAAGTWLSKAGDKALAAAGLGAWETEGEGTAIGGSRADQWAANQKGKLDLMRAALAKYPSIDIVHIYIGGNDFLRFAMEHDLAKLSAAERKAEWDTICGNIAKLVEAVLAVRPDIRVVLADYDYLDPERISAVYKPGAANVFSGVPAKQFNEYLMELGREKSALAARVPRCYYAANWGVVKQPMPDGVHPTAEGFQAIFANVIQKYYRNWLAPAKHSTGHAAGANPPVILTMNAGGTGCRELRRH